MIRYSVFVVITISIAAFALLSLTGYNKATAFEPVAVIELFTSQGCSSCPAADKLFSKTIAEARSNSSKIFALSYHVDYWNRLGWADPFSDKKYSDRQSLYASVLNPGRVYTPQMVINGKREFVGSDQNKLEKALEDALKENSKTAFKKFNVITHAGQPVQVQYELEGEFQNCNVLIALISLKETTQVKRGENGGRTLENENVVRELVSAKASPSGEMNFKNSNSIVVNNTAVVGFIQHSNDLRIIGAVMKTL